MNRYNSAQPNTSAKIPPFQNENPFLVVTPLENGRLEKTGQYPAFLTPSELSRLPSPQSPIKAIRARCVDCCGGVVSEVRKCTAWQCPLWGFRMGKNPFHGMKGA